MRTALTIQVELSSEQRYIALGGPPEVQEAFMFVLEEIEIGREQPHQSSLLFAALTTVADYLECTQGTPEGFITRTQ